MGFATGFGLNTNPNAKTNTALANVFGDSDSDEPESTPAPQDIVRFQLDQQRKKIEADMKRQTAEVTKQDPTAYEYDEVFDHMKQKNVAFQEKKQLKQSIRGKPKYVDKLIREAEKRKHQNDLWYEKKLQREQEVEQAAYGETEKFVTPSYKRHLEELKVFADKQKAEEARDEAVLQKQGMGGFYANMLGFATGTVGLKDENEVEAKEPELKKQATESTPAPSIAPATEIPTSIPISSNVETLKSAALDLTSAVGAKEVDEETRLKRLQELNKSSVTDDKAQSARERYLARKMGK